MGTTRGIVSVLVLCAPAWTLNAESLISYKIELGGDNHAAAWRNPPDCAQANLYPVFTGGSDLDGQFVCVGHTATWSVRVAVSGVHSSGAMPRGAANLVASLELYKDGVLTAVSANGPEGKWLSTINNGVAGTRQTVCGEPADPVELAAFPVSWSIDGSRYARVIDGPDKGGPLGGTSGSSTAYWQYPSAAGYPAGSTALPGTLVGMGAGYANFIPTDALYSGAGGNSTPGIGVTTATDCALALGTGPVFEGQFDTAGMTAGTYVLKVVPGTGNNILVIPQDSLSGACEYPNDTAFAVETDASAGDTITFVAGAGCHYPQTRVLGRHLFYYKSHFGSAIATDKTPLLPGAGLGQFANVSSYSRGINGIYIDVDWPWDPGGLVVGPTDFLFRQGNSTSFSTWTVAADPISITVLHDCGVDGSDRIILIWADNAIPNKHWLQVTLRANSNTRLTADDVFYYGLLIGETGAGNSLTALAVTSADYNNCYNNRTPPLPLTLPITNVYDFNRDRVLTSGDYNLSYNERGSLLDTNRRLNLITVP